MGKKKPECDHDYIIDQYWEQWLSPFSDKHFYVCTKCGETTTEKPKGKEVSK